LNRLFAIYQHDEIRELSDVDLPLIIGSGVNAHIRLPEGSAIEAHIAYSRGHLFLQPANGTSAIYHNNNHITTSTWIKSGDLIRIADSMLYFHISGDRLEIRLSSALETALIPPTPATRYPPEVEKKQKKLPRTSPQVRQPEKNKKLYFLTGGIFLLLIIAAVFVLMARSVEVSVEPTAEKFAISGFPPVFRFGSHYLALKGDYTVQASRSGYQDLNETITVRGNDQNRFTFTLKKLPGLVDITCPPEKAEAFIDHVLVGTTPLAGLEIPAGEHQLCLVKEGFLPIKQVIEIEGLGRKQNFTFELHPDQGKITVVSNPSGAVVFAGETRLGTTPLSRKLPSGTYTLTLRKKGFSPAEIKIEIAGGGIYTPETITLSPAPATVSIKSTPTGAMLFVDSIFKGTTPITLSLDGGKPHTISLTHSGYQEKKTRLSLDPGISRELSFTMLPEYGIVFIATEPANSRLLVDGRPHNGPATGRLRLTTTRHILTIKARGYKTVKRTVTPDKTHSRQVNIRLEPVAALPVSKTAARKERISASGHEMIRLEPAVFTMGASRREPGRRANEQLRQVEITKLFYLSVREVSNDQFRRFKPGHRSGTTGGKTFDGGSQPVAMISWEDAIRYCNWLSKREGLEPFYREENATMTAVIPATNGYRLPFEAEWAYAARMAGRAKPARYPWDGNFPPETRNGNYADESAREILSMVIKNYNDGYPVTAPVAGFPANKGGFHDLGGNVSEWCHDFYTPNNISGTDGREIDPTGPATGTHHVVRGSSWSDSTITELRLSYRTYSRSPKNDIGFRIARNAR
jgi:formylglycine-generating enzyme required for sulfatase activity